MKITIEEFILKNNKMNGALSPEELIEHKMNEALSQQEEQFVYEYVRTRNAYGSYRKSFGEPTSSGEPFVMQQKPRIQKAIKELEARLKEERLQDLKEYILDLAQTAQECLDNGERGNAIRCKELIGKALGHLAPTQHNTQVNILNANFTPDIALENLRKSLQIENNDATLTQNNANSTLQGK